MRDHYAAGDAVLRHRFDGVLIVLRRAAACDAIMGSTKEAPVKLGGAK